MLRGRPCGVPIASMLRRDEDKIDEQLNSQRGAKYKALDITAEARKALLGGPGPLCQLDAGTNRAGKKSARIIGSALLVGLGVWLLGLTTVVLCGERSQAITTPPWERSDSRWLLLAERCLYRRSGLQPVSGGIGYLPIITSSAVGRDRHRRDGSSLLSHEGDLWHLVSRSITNAMAGGKRVSRVVRVANDSVNCRDEAIGARSCEDDLRGYLLYGLLSAGLATPSLRKSNMSCLNVVLSCLM